MAFNPATYQIDPPTTCMVDGCDESPEDLHSHITDDHIFLFRISSALNSPSGMVPPDQNSQQTWLPFTARLNPVYNPLTRDELSMANIILTSMHAFLDVISHPAPGQSDSEFLHQQDFYCPIPSCSFFGPHTRFDLRHHFYATHTNALNLKCPIEGCNVVFHERTPDLYQHVVFTHNQKGFQAYTVCMQALNECRNKETMLKCILGSSPVFRCPFPDCGDLFQSYESTAVHITQIHCQDDYDVVNFFNAAETDCNGTPEEDNRRISRASQALTHLTHQNL
ncbi:hypothetical protein BZA77DRAFT_292113 [Pyronema omphalodes]|nr:hypothetical protein BZA77DRAFT_292113 [Pyronema omphalodes]